MLDKLPAEIYELSGLTITFRVVLAIFVGGLIGTERDIKNRAAGIRTHMLVCLGAAVVMMTNQYVVESFPESNLDITRMGAQVVSEIGRASCRERVWMVVWGVRVKNREQGNCERIS